MLLYWTVQDCIHDQNIIIKMDKLKEMMTKMKPKQKITIQKQVIDKQKDEFLKQQIDHKRHREQEEQKRLSEIADYYTKPRKLVKMDQPTEPPLPVEEVKEGLRKLHQPVTLFGESAIQRYQRLLKVQEFSEKHPNEDMRLYDEDFIRKVKENEEYEQLDAKYRDMLIEPKILSDLATRAKKQAMVLSGEKKEFAQMCDEIHLWIVKVLKGWGECLEQQTQTKNQLASKYKSKFALLEETNSEMSSFIWVLRQRKGDREMIQSIYYIMNCCLIREYVEANTRYIELSIGNAPWPMGVAMLGITVKKNAERLSYVLDNEMTRKWILGLKRLITVSQELYPNEDKMKMVGYTVHSLI